MLAKPRKELNEQSPQSMAGLRVQIPPQVSNPFIYEVQFLGNKMREQIRLTVLDGRSKTCWL